MKSLVNPRYVHITIEHVTQNLSEEVCEDEHGHAEEEGGGHQHDPREDVLGLIEDVVELQPVEVGPVLERLILQRAVVLVICNLQPDAALNKNNQCVSYL